VTSLAVIEHRPTALGDLAPPAAQALVALLGLALVAQALVLRRRRLHLGRTAVAAAFVALGFFARRNVGLVGLGVMPLLAEGLGGVAEAIDRRRLAAVGIAAVVIVSSLGTGARIVAGRYYDDAHLTRRFGLGVSPVLFPLGAVDFVVAHAAGARIMNDDMLGGLLLWRHPGVPVFIDGRMQVYPSAVFGAYEASLADPSTFPALAARWGVTAVVLYHPAPGRLELARRIARLPGWRLAYLDAGGGSRGPRRSDSAAGRSCSPARGVARSGAAPLPARPRGALPPRRARARRSRAGLRGGPAALAGPQRGSRWAARGRRTSLTAWKGEGTAKTMRLVAAFLLLVAACGGGPRGEASAPAGAAPASDAVIGQRVVDYFQKTVTTPGLSFKVGQLADAEIPGWRKGTLEVALGDQHQSVPFYVSRDGRYLLRGEAVDLTVDPLKQVMSKIKLDGVPSRGPADAKVTIVEYSDFECPFCSRAYATMEDQVLKDYGDRVRFVYKNFPLTSIHPWAEDGAIAAACAAQQGNEQFWAMYKGLFTHQSEITKDNVKDKAVEIGQAAGLDAAKLKDCIEGRKSLDAVKADEAEAASLGVGSTPTFFINGRRVSGAQSYEGFKQIIDHELGAQG